MRQRRAWLTVLRTNSNADFDLKFEGRDLLLAASIQQE
jgi:hypothetical protein